MQINKNLLCILLVLNLILLPVLSSGKVNAEQVDEGLTKPASIITPIKSAEIINAGNIIGIDNKGIRVPLKDIKGIQGKVYVINQRRVAEDKAPTKPFELKMVKGSTYKGTRTSTSKDPFENDIYYITQADIESFIKAGHTMDDIFKADDIGNRILEDPKNLLKIKRETGKDLDTIAKELIADRNQKQLQKYKEKYPDEFNKIGQEMLNDDQKIMLLTIFDVNNNGEPIDKLIRDYKEKGEEAIKERFDSKKIRVSQEKMDKHNLTLKDVEGLTDDFIDKFEIISSKTGLSVKEVIDKFNAAKEKK